MASSFFSEFGLTWYLEELNKKEFMKFKGLLKEEILQLDLKQIPWCEVKRASREDLANLLIKYYEKQQAWAVTFSIFQKINRKDLCDRAKRESTGHTKRYQAHIQKKISNMWSREPITAIHDFFDQKITPKEREYFEPLIAPKTTRKQSHTVLLKGIPGTGKTMVLMKLILAWAEGSLCQDRFSYVFYFCCRELRTLTETSLAELISRDWPDSGVAIAEIMSQPEQLLFIIDSFDELKCSLDGPEAELCSDWMEKQPIKVLLGSLLRKKMLPESSLIIATTPSYSPGLEERLESPDIRTAIGFEDSNKEEYFHCVIKDSSRAMQAFRLVREYEQLSSMCQLPVLCWIVCTCLKQEIERGRDLALICQRTTSLYASFIFNLFTPKGANCPNRQSQGQLLGLCSLAAEGMWTDTFVLRKEALSRNGIADSDIPTLLDIKILLRDKNCENSYVFIHPSVQEFCAAMFYLLKSHSEHPNSAVACTETLLFTFLKKVKDHWVSFPRFLFGLLHEKEQQMLNAFFGFQLLSHEIKQRFHQCMKSIGESEDLQEQVDFLGLFYCLFEMQNEAFVKQTMDFLQEVNFSITKKSDLIVCAYCLKKSSGLRKLLFSIQNVFKEENGHCSMSDFSLTCWHEICSVLTTNQHLQELQVKDGVLSESACETLYEQLRQPNCVLQSLEINRVVFYCECSHLFEVLIHNSNLKHFKFTHISLSRSDVKLLGDTLKHPECNIERLQLVDCGLVSDDCDVFASVLVSSKKLKHLDIACNYLEEGLRSLCRALCHPDCTLSLLVLANCHLSEHCWEYLSEVILSNKFLRHLDLSANVLTNEGLKTLCEALRHPECSLNSLCLIKCSIAASGCQALASVLSSNQNLKILQIGGNNIEDVGVKLLCGALVHPNCHLEVLGLEACKLTSVCCEDLSLVLTHSKTLWGLNLSRNALDYNGVVVLCEALRHPECSLHLLGVSKADLDEETQALLTAEEEKNSSLTIIGSQ